ncbi:SWIM zinc finger family protein [Pseudosporangium ferrugineum]|uniref:SWIM zinc finger protein n=1 Tax=Pseudosporangium ferrugineum TaxID=439699 RepID=A0A2T0RQM2_9ACTN|nr:SWIM zinc finger family protein [Pseudosporangium ferrugineum]PRY23468.1 SWIM zinc finger protein [Pseudosporangium ferrugineum]
MPVERWSTAQVTAVAPDPGSLRGARSVGTAGKWQETGLSGDVLWGLCRGSGRNPYQVCVDLSGPAYKCSCPSRKFPCKHALGLLLLWAEGAAPGPATEAPAFVTEWQAGRAVRAAKAAAPRTDGPADPELARKRAQQREERVAAGMAELSRWLDDQIQQGLAGAERSGAAPFETMAARLVDAQAPGAASAVRRLGGLAGIGPQWADRLLGDLALLRLLVSAHERLASLTPAMVATVRSRIGFPVSTEDVLAGTPVHDQWQVLGQTDSDDGALTTRRTWLRGVDSGRFALHLAFAAPGQTLAADLVPGTSFEGSLCFYPGVAPLRALIKDRRTSPRPLSRPSGAGTVREALRAWAAVLAAEPWRFDVPMLLAGVVPSADGHLTDTAGDSLSLAPGHREPWWLLAAAGGAPATVAAEWTPAGLRPLAAWVDDRFVPAAPPVPGGAAPRAPELPPTLLAAALVGTGRRPFTASTVEVGERPITLGPGASLLDAAAAALLYRRAGTTPAIARPPIEAAPPEPGPRLPDAAGARLLRLLSDGGAPGGSQQAQELLGQWLAAAAAHGGHVPPESLPALLDAGRRNAVVRPAIGQVAGERGRWLAALRPDWRWLRDEAPGAAAGDDPTIWDTGTGGQRLAHLTRLRAQDPAAGLALLRSTWPTETSEDRARFVGALATGLSPDDDAFLDSALDDRRKEVREAALDLLRRLPGSSLGRRMAARATAAVTLERRTLGRDRVAVTPPAELTADLRRDGVGAQPARGTGLQGWLLEEIVAGTPLTTWTEAFGRPAADVVDLARGNDWESALLHGWAKAAIVQGSADWASALVRNDSREGAAGLREAVRWDLHLLLPSADLARIAADFLRREDHLAHRLLAVHPGAWPDELAVAVVETIAHRARTDRHSWQLAELCRAAATAMPPAYATPVARLATQLDQDSADPSRIRPIADLARTLTFRHEMLQEFQ